MTAPFDALVRVEGMVLRRVDRTADGNTVLTLRRQGSMASRYLLIAGGSASDLREGCALLREIERAKHTISPIPPTGECPGAAPAALVDTGRKDAHARPVGVLRSRTAGGVT